MPVPTFIAREQIHVADKRCIERLDAYSAPRLVEYLDERSVRDRAQADGGKPERLRHETAAAERGATVRSVSRWRPSTPSASTTSSSSRPRRATAWRLAARERLPDSPPRPAESSAVHQAEDAVLRGQGEPEEQSQLGFTYLRPLQMAYESPEVHAARSAWAWSTPTGRRSCSSTRSPARAGWSRRTTDGEDADGGGGAAVREERVRRVLQGGVRQGMRREDRRAILTEYSGTWALTHYGRGAWA